LKNPEILFCDEATSAVDSHTESRIQANLSEIFKGRTSVHIAHRLSSIADADDIIVLGTDGIVERGTHQELLRRGEEGVYRKLWLKQLNDPSILAPLPAKAGANTNNNTETKSGKKAPANKEG